MDKYFFSVEDAQCSEAGLTVLRFLVFEIWSILYSKFLVNWRFMEKLLGGLGPPQPLGCRQALLHWLEFSKSTGCQVSITWVSVSEFVYYTRNVEYKFDHVSKIKNSKTVRITLRIF